jgi:hypothetical protein
LFPIVELVSRRVSLPQTPLGSDPNFFQSCRKLFARPVNLLPVLVGCTSGDTARYDDSLNGSYPWRKDRALVIFVNHDHHTNRTGTKAPRVLLNVQLSLARWIVLILYDNVEHLSPGKVLTKAVRGGGLNSSSGGRDKPLQGRVKPSGEFSFCNTTVSASAGEERCVAFLPKKLSRAQEWFCESGCVKKRNGNNAD